MNSLLFRRSILLPLVLAAASTLLAADPPPDYLDRLTDPQFVAMQPVAPVQPQQAELPEPRIEAADGERIGSVWGGMRSDLPTELAASPVASIVSGEEAAIRGTTDVGDLLEQSGDTGNVMLFTRSPISNEPRIRGYRYAQIRNTVNGAFFFPIRPDLDTALSRIDSSIVQDVSIIDGPYTVRQGPGFAFINVQMKETERCCGGTGTQGRTASSYDTNGEAWYGTQSFHAGECDYGYRVGYVQRVGVDYEAGGGFPVAASHNMRNWNFAFGYDPSCDSSFEFNYIRNDLTGIDLPSQVNDLVFLTADAFQLRYELGNQYAYDDLSVNLWYNTGHFLGTPDHKMVDDPFTGLPLTNVTWGRNYSGGIRLLVSWGDADDGRVAIGMDFVVERHQYLEREWNSEREFSYYGIPPAHSFDSGLFIDTILPLTDRLVIKAGGRGDYVGVDSAGIGVDEATGQPEQGSGSYQSFTLGAGYVIGEYEVSEELTAMLGFGVAQRAPTSTDLFASWPYLAILQQGPFFFPEGDPNVTEETAKQLDAGLTADYGDFHGGIRGFCSWINDFITYDELDKSINHNATLAGGELYGDLKLSRRLTPFASLSYVQGDINGWDVSTHMLIREPLWGVPPMQALVGLRLSDRCDGRHWGMEYRAQIVDNQNRINLNTGWSPVTDRYGEVRTPGFVTHDLRAYWHINQGVTFVAGAENMGNRNYQEHLDSRIDSNYDHPGGVFRRGRNFYFLLQSDY